MSQETLDIEGNKNSSSEVINPSKKDLDKHFMHSDFQDRLREENKAPISKLIKICCFCSTFMTIEFIGGYMAGSIAIMSDAAHLLSDLAGFLISLMSLYVAQRPANKDLTYGYHRSEIIGSLSSILIIWVLTAWLITEAIQRIFNPRPISGIIMVGIAACGLLFNIIMSRVLAYNPVPNTMDGKFMTDAAKEWAEEKKGEDEPLLEGQEQNEEENNMDAQSFKSNAGDNNPVIRAAYIHILGDMIQSFGVLLAAFIIWMFQDTNPRIRIFDPICTFCFAIVVLCTTVPVSKDCLSVLMEASPDGINYKELFKEICEIEGVINIHDFHCWELSIGRPAITIHILSKKPQKTLEEATRICHNYGLRHCTIQVEDHTQRKRMSFKKCDHVERNDIH